MNLIRLYNRNRKEIIILILIVVFIIGGIHFLNNLVKKNNESKTNIGSSSEKATTTSQPQQSAISSTKVSDTVYTKHSELINMFIKYCNEGNNEEAYNLLSKDCKEVLFPTLEYFTKYYCNKIYSEEKLYTIKNWTGNIYKIRLTENMLSTGKANNGSAIEDYFTIVQENSTCLLNINGFINRVKINENSEKSNIKIDVMYKDVYMDYVIYSIKAQNGTSNTIFLDSGESTQTIYITDSKNIKYVSYRNEIPNAELLILPNSTKTINIKFYSEYVSTKEIEAMIFNDIVLDYNTDSKNSTNRLSMKIDL